MKNIRDAYNKGTNGEQLTREQQKFRAARIMHRIGLRTNDRLLAYNDAAEKQEDEYLLENIELAKGCNKTALQAIHASKRIPNQSESSPGESKTTLDGETRQLQNVYWMGYFGKSESGEDAAYSPTPLVSELSSMKVGHVELGGAAVEVPVRQILIVCERVADDEGRLGGTSTKMTVNWDPRNRDLEKYENTTVDTAQIVIDSEGKASNIGLEYEGRLFGYQPQDVTQTTINFEEILESLKSAVELTTDAYNSIDPTAI